MSEPPIRHLKIELMVDAGINRRLKEIERDEGTSPTNLVLEALAIWSYLDADDRAQVLRLASTLASRRLARENGGLQ